MDEKREKPIPQKSDLRVLTETGVYLSKSYDVCRQMGRCFTWTGARIRTLTNE